MHKLILKQLEKATAPTGTIDLGALTKLVSSAYEEADRDRIRTDRSMGLMIAELEQTHSRLLDAFDVVPEGLAMFDAENRYVLWNRRYAEMHAGILVLAPGKRFADAVREAVANGRYPEAIGREEEWLAERLAQHAAKQSSNEYRLPGGRWIRVEERRTASGGSIGVRIDITDLKRREESFRLLFDDNPVPMWLLDLENHKFLAVNDAAVVHYGYSRDKFLTLTAFDIRPPDEHEKYRQFMHEGKPSQGGMIWRHQKADGTIIYVSVYARSLTYQSRAARLNAIVDVTERKRAEDAVRRTQQFLNTIVENVPAALFVTNISDNRYVLLNRMAEDFLGVPRADVIGKTPYDFFTKEQADAMLARDHQALKSKHAVSFEDYPMEMSRNTTRIIRSKRVAIADDHGEPQYVLGIAEDITERKRVEAQVAHLAHHDPLTDLPNRASFNEHFATTVQHATASNDTFAVICIDLDRFKEINDIFGHGMGDEILCQVSERLNKAVENDAFLARLGGDEFAIIAAGGPQPETAASLAERLLATMADDFSIGEQRLRSGLSIGVAIYPNDGTDATTLLANADAALYRAKAEGRGAIRFFEAEMDQRLRERRAIQHDLQSAIERNELSLHYQPQAHISGKILGFEALARWQHPIRGSVPPGTFIPIAEECGQIVPIGEWVLRTACREAASWPRPLQIAINISPVQFRHGDLPSLVHSVLLETGLQAGRLEIEITEGVLIGDLSRAVSILRRLKVLGVRIAMDDFGTGYSSLSYLQAFPFDKIKIDQTFISNLDRNTQSAAIVRAVVGLGHGLKLPVVAEGVETKDQLAFLTHETCDEVQGFLVGRPRPIQDYAELVGRPATTIHLSRSA